MPQSVATSGKGSNVNSKTNIHESWTSYFDRIDEAISESVFRLGLPKWIELIASIPANFFGTTACLSVGPLWIAILALTKEEYQQQSEGTLEIVVLQLLAAAATIGYIVAWGYLQLADAYWLGATLFWNKLLYALAYPWALMVLGVTVGRLPREVSQPVMALAISPLILFPVVLVVMNYVKAATKRPRPAKKDLDRGGIWIARKQFPDNTRFLARFSTYQSFPSGDVMMATLLAIPLWSSGLQFKKLAVAIVLSSGLGRMYVLAHHLTDVVAGACFTLGIHTIVCLTGYHPAEHGKWWHPLLVMACHGIFERLTKRNLSAAIRSSGVFNND